ncbi:MAG: sodium:solute symporter family protein [Melioribacteraceae bacterium]|nr:sodium:solute symporter family protein [Melioribacteraceae bacterium]
MIAMLSIGIYFLKRNSDADDYYVGGRNMGSFHIGLSVVATDVGGGFSIGLGGLGFIMGISGSWMLFTGLIGAWLSAVFLIPKVSRMPEFKSLYTFPQIFGVFYDRKVALIAGVISAIGYIGFTSSQILAGAKLASASFIDLNLNTALIIMGIIVVVYTFLGGIRAVIYTDTVQWSILIIGLIFIGIPLGYNAVGGYSAISKTLPSDFFSLSNLDWQDFINWFVTIVPIWFVGMTLYQRIFACRTEQEAKKAWFIAGLFEYPAMAFMGVLLGLFARAAAENGMFGYLGYSNTVALDPEMGLPMLLRTILPVGLMGLMMSAYFSAIMSTADSCLMAASGNVMTDILDKFFNMSNNQKSHLRYSQVLTLLLGSLSLLLASSMQNVLELMLYSYAFMVSGLFIPLIGAFYWKYSNSNSALWAMILGGGTTIALIALDADLPLQLDANIYGIAISAVAYFGIGFFQKIN